MAVHKHISCFLMRKCEDKSKVKLFSLFEGLHHRKTQTRKTKRLHGKTNQKRTTIRGSREGIEISG